MFSVGRNVIVKLKDCRLLGLPKSSVEKAIG